MNTKHTPGKWAIRDNEIIGPYGTSKSICEMTGDFCTPEEMEANKQLIASAPELLAALINLHKVVMQSNDKMIFDNGENAKIVSNAFDAIQNATQP